VESLLSFAAMVAQPLYAALSQLNMHHHRFSTIPGLRGDHMRSAKAAARGQTVDSRSDASIRSPHACTCRHGHRDTPFSRNHLSWCFMLKPVGC
jgi:hypothetical protein